MRLFDHEVFPIGSRVGQTGAADLEGMAPVGRWSLAAEVGQRDGL